MLVEMPKVINPENLGYIINALVTVDPVYKNYININWNDKKVNNSQKVKSIISEIFNSKLKIKINLDDTISDVRGLQPGDILTSLRTFKPSTDVTSYAGYAGGQSGGVGATRDFSSDSVKYFVITNYVSDDSFVTYPRMSEEELQQFRGSAVGGFTIVKRPDVLSLDPTTVKSIESLANKLFPSIANNTIKSGSETYNSVDHSNISDGTLQIGDIFCVVDPTQISFSTYNGYQYFPTLRTQGNPKVPTSQQVKNVGINLIFPNQDSINFQLLPIFAMFKRSPFVNIKNIDICSFFSELTSSNGGFLPVALESISIQSVQGFPNTLQVQINFLPFDPSANSPGLKVLRSFSDVRVQQQALSRDYELERIMSLTETKLNQQSVVKGNLQDITGREIFSSYDFQESLPFRVFYQSLIADRKTVLNEYGVPVSVTDFNGNVINSKFYELDSFRPRNPSNVLCHYNTDSNLEPITFSYRYLQGDSRSVAKDISNKQLEVQEETLNALNKMFVYTSNGETLLKQVLNQFGNLDDFYKTYEFKFSEMNNIVANFATMHGLNVKGIDVEIKGLFDLIQKTFLQGTSIPQIYNATKQTLQIPGAVVESSKTTPDIFGILKTIVYSGSKSAGDKSNTNITVYQAAEDLCNNIMKKVGNDKIMKANLVAFLADIGQRIRGNLLTDMITVAPNPQTGSYFQTQRLPLAEESVVIDNVKDIVVGWNLTFANKFVPITLQAFKYPIYQHIGSDDITLALVINSTTSGYGDLKNKLSMLSERLYESVKITMLHAPELSLYIDPRISVSVPNGHIFKVFGLEKVVLTSSSSSNIQGTPGAWNTSIQFAQAGFTIDQYHSIDSKQHYYAIEEAFAKIFARLSYNKTTGNFTVFKYSVRSPEFSTRGFPVTTTPNSQFEEVTDLDTIIRLNFLYSEYGQGVKDHIENLLKTTQSVVGQSTITEYQNQLAKLQNVFRRDTDEGLTSKINQIATNSEFNKVLKIINTQYNDILYNQSEGLKNLLVEKKTFLQHLSAIALEPGTLKLAGVGGIALSILARHCLPAAIVVGGIGVVGFGTVASTSAGIEVAKTSIKESFSNFFDSISQNFAKSSLNDLGYRIVRDPAIRNTLIKAGILDSNFESIIQSDITSRFVNCYDDFDVPPIFNVVKGSDDTFLDGAISLSPDFYLSNNIIPDYESLEYLDNSTKRTISMGKLCASMSLFEHKDVIDKYNKILSTLGEAGKNDSIVKKVGDEILGTDSISVALSSLQKLYYQIATGDYKTELTEDSVEKYLKEFDAYRDKVKAKYPGVGPINTFKDKEWVRERETLEKTLRARMTQNVSVENNDSMRKLNLIHSARNMCLIELLEMYLSINEYYLQMMKVNTDKKTPLPMTKDEAIKKSFLELHGTISDILLHANSPDSKPIVAKNENGGIANTEKGAKQYLSLPAIRVLETQVYNKIGYYIRLNNAIRDFAATGIVNLDGVPEIKMLTYWNVQQAEANIKRTQLLQDFHTSHQLHKDTTIRFYPTFKLYFIEEDTNIFNSLNEYYAYKAIQSIEITYNKTSSSRVARIILNNITGTITDRLSLMREKSDFTKLEYPSEPDNAFFGTLDVKPGTSIMVKMGYAANDTQLETLFIGRVIEMNVGATCEIIAQSYGAQLNHEIMAYRFGMIGSVKAHGDVASSVLDMIPGLEKLGKKPLLAMGSTQFSGKNQSSYKGSFGDRYLLGNLLGSVSALTFAQDNPRDDNIYLKYDMNDTTLHRPTFDWLINNQTVWQVLQEMALYNNDTCVTVKRFNTDMISEKKDIRESIVIGNRAGYYKYTDAFSFSTLNTKIIDDVIAEWDSLKTQLPKNIKDIGTVFDEIKNVRGSELNFSKKLNSKYIKLYQFIQKPLNAKVLSAHIFSNSKYSPGGFVQDIYDKISIMVPFGALQDFYSSVQYISGFDPIADSDLTTFDFMWSLDRYEAFNNTVKGLVSRIADGSLPIDMIPEKLYNVSNLPSNMDQTLVNDPRYKKIQQHHLITDISDIITNNISLSSSFNNAVNLYYLNEPKFVDQNGLGLTKEDHINVWSIKSFGALKDEQTRILNSFQKNVDTNWFDITNFVKNPFKRARVKDLDIKSIHALTAGLDVTPELNWNIYPSFVIVGLNLLRQEVAKAYQGTIEIVGNPTIEPFDIIHIEDYTNDMHGTFEVEEVTHTFTPETGFKTIITPNLLTYDRNPVQMQDVSIINRIYGFSNSRKLISRAINLGLGIPLAGLGTFGLVGGIAGGEPIAAIAGGASLLAGLGLLWNGTVGIEKRATQFLYDQMGNILGRDCINFTTLIYHGSPYIAGFDGVDYTNLKTLISENIKNIKEPINRFAAMNDEMGAFLATGGSMEDYGLWSMFVNKLGLSSMRSQDNLSIGITSF